MSTLQLDTVTNSGTMRHATVRGAPLQRPLVESRLLATLRNLPEALMKAVQHRAIALHDIFNRMRRQGLGP
jgi:hypothetical protein